MKAVLYLVLGAMGMLAAAAFTGRKGVAGVAFILLGLAMLAALAKGLAAVKLPALVIGSYFVIFGALLTFWTGLQKQFGLEDRILAYIVGLGIGLLMLGLGVFNIARRASCREPVEAVCEGFCPVTSAHGRTLYAARFYFRYQGRHFRVINDKRYSRRKSERKYQTGRSYTLHISPGDPSRFRSGSPFSSTDLLLITMGALLCLAPFQF